MKIALIQTNPVIGNFATNIKRISQYIDTAKQNGCQLAILPELTISGYPPQDYLEHESFLTAHDKALHALISQTDGIGVLCGALTRHTGSTGKPLHNSAVFFENGTIIFSSKPAELVCAC